MKILIILVYLSSFFSFGQVHHIIFDEDLFLETMQYFPVDNIDSIKIFVESNNEVNEVLNYNFSKTENQLIIEKLKKVMNVEEGIYFTAEKFYLNSKFRMDSVTLDGISEGVLEDDTWLNCRLIKYENNIISEVTIIGNQQADTTIYSYTYIDNFITKVKVEDKVTKQERTWFVNYYLNDSAIISVRKTD